MGFWNIILLAALAAGCLLSGNILVHFFQLESYQFPGYFRSVRRNLPRVIMPGLLMNIVWFVSLIVFALIVPEDNSWLPQLCVSICMIIGGIIVGKCTRERKAKKPLKFTMRIKRLYGICLIAIFLTAILCELFFKPVMYLFPLFLPVWIALGGLVAWPVEKAISEMYFRDAQRILKERKDLIRIGITGSWGKTSVKFILGTILQEKYYTLVTPSSFNTPMGVTKVIRSSLEPGHRVFIAEMGARHVGDIRELCRLVHPEFGILTSVGPQHLDTFKTIERIAGTKYELIEAIPENGACFFADDQGICRELYQKTEKRKWLTGTEKDIDDIWVEDIRVSPEGSRFTLCTKTEKVSCNTKLLGEINIRNILLCVAVAKELGLTMEQIVRGISRVEPVEHRMQIIPGGDGITLIDDAFNSNIRGAEQAFKVLKAFSGNRIVVTPGMVELGKQEYSMNREFGKMMADGCDVAILVGKKRSEAISEGLKAAGFSPEKIYVVDSLDDANALMRKIIRRGDVVLFENDLPDNYTE